MTSGKGRLAGRPPTPTPRGVTSSKANAAHRQAAGR